MNWQRPLIGRAGYYINIKVSTGNADEILIANSSFFRSTDGGKNFVEVPWGGDNHDIWIDPKNPDHFGLTNDAGVRLTANHGRTFQTIALPIGQMYHVAVDNQIPYWVYGNRQDNGTMRGPSTAPEAAAGGGRGGGGRWPRRGAPTPTGAADAARRAEARCIARRPTRWRARRAGGAARRGRGGRGADSTSADSTGGGGGRGAAGLFGGTSTWDHGIGGCESGFTLPDLTDPNIVWASCYGNEVTRYDHTAKRAHSVSPWIHTLDSPPNTLKYRCHWTPPLAIDPFDHNTVYYGCQVIFKTSNGGQSWTVMSPDLSTNDTSRIVSSGGIVEDNLGQFYGEVVFAIAPSEIQRGLIWAGTNDGQIWNTRDGGNTWTNVTKNITGLPVWGTVRKIEPSHFDPGTAYAAIDFHMMDNRKPFIYKTTDFGQTWKNITGDLPATHPLDYVMAVAENPNRKGMLFAGTGHGFYYSRDDGAHWTQFKEGLPQTAVSWIVVPKLWHDVVVSTYGRGIYILKDIAPLEHDRQRAQTRRRALRAASGVSAIAKRACRHHVRAQAGVAATGARGDPRFGGQGRARDSVADARRHQPRDVGPALRRAARRRAAHRGAGQSAHLRRAAIQQPADAADHALGNSGRPDRRPARHPREVHDPTDGQRQDRDATARRAQGRRDQDERCRPGRVDRGAGARTGWPHGVGGSRESARGDAQTDRRSAKANASKADIVDALKALDTKMLNVELRLAVAVGHERRRQVLRRAVQDLHEPDLAERRCGQWRG